MPDAAAQTTPSPPAPLGKQLESISLDDLQDDVRSEARDDDMVIRDCHFVASYNLLERPTGSISVPGLLALPLAGTWHVPYVTNSS